MKYDVEFSFFETFVIVSDFGNCTLYLILFAIEVSPYQKAVRFTQPFVEFTQVFFCILFFVRDWTGYLENVNKQLKRRYLD